MDGIIQMDAVCTGFGLSSGIIIRSSLGGSIAKIGLVESTVIVNDVSSAK